MDTQIQIRIDGESKARWNEAAKRRGLSLSEWLRHLADNAASEAEAITRLRGIVKPAPAAAPVKPVVRKITDIVVDYDDV